jgi:hypothetical protein
MHEPLPILAGYLAEREAAVELKSSINTLRCWRTQRKGPKWVKVAGKIYYSRDALMNWLKSIEQPVRKR